MEEGPLFRNCGDQLEIHYQGEWTRLLDLSIENLRDQSALCRWLGEQYPLFEATPSLRLPQRYCKSVWKEQLVIFGGSFSPWHKGHAACLDLCPIGPILVAPDRNPQKILKFNPFEHFQRLALELAKTPHSIYPGFLGLDEGNPTSQWIAKVCVPKLYLLMGDDNFLQFHNWQNYRHILQHLRGLLVCPRLGAKSELKAQARHLRKIKRELEIEFLSHHHWEDLSSREIRSNNS